jgi:putative SOS response-associated peptidase YedK
MPVILHARDYNRWLNTEEDARPPLDLVRPFESDAMTMAPANRMVGNVLNTGPEMLKSA